jgi:hypothetical protein
MNKSKIAIHAPVPGYETKIAKSMDRFFNTIPAGKIVKRANWALQSNSTLFKLDGNHIATTPSSANSPSGMAPATRTPTAAELAEWATAAEAVEPEKCFLRCERQTLHRLEKTGALVFSFKTYLYALGEVKEEGSGAEMADAIEGLGKGSVSGMMIYKRGVIWGEKVTKYLRGV